MATVVALTRADGQHATRERSSSCPWGARGDAAGLVWRAHVDPAHVGEVQRALYAAYPSVSVINVAQALETIRLVVIQITYVIQFLAAFSIFAGVVILASSIAGTGTGGPRGSCSEDTGRNAGTNCEIFSIEFAVLGLVLVWLGWSLPTSLRRFCSTG